MNVHSQKTNIGIRHLKAFLAVAEMQSFARAAEYLHVVPSALTETIRQLEAENGVQVFDRRARPVSLTPAGAELVVRARRLVVDFDSTLFDLRQLGGLERGTVRVGAAPSMVRFPVSPAITAFRGLHPAIDITVYDDIAERLGTMVMDRVVDFALAERWHDSSELRYEPLLNDPFVLVCQRDHPLAAWASVPLSAIPMQELILLDDSTGIGKLVAGREELAGLLGGSRLRAHSTIALLIMISEGMGLALLPRLAASAVETSNLVQIPLADLFLQRQICVVSRSHSSLSPAPAALLSLIRSGLAASALSLISSEGRRPAGMFLEK